MANKVLSIDEIAKIRKDAQIKASMDKNIQEEMRYKHLVKKDQAAYQNPIMQEYVENQYLQLKPNSDPLSSITSEADNAVKNWKEQQEREKAQKESADALKQFLEQGGNPNLYVSGQTAPSIFETKSEKETPYVSKTDSTWNPYVDMLDGKTYVTPEMYMTRDELITYYNKKREDVLKGQYTGEAEKYKDSLNLSNRVLQKKIDEQKDTPYIGKLGLAVGAGVTDAASGFLDALDMLRGKKPDKLRHGTDTYFAATGESIDSGIGKLGFDLTRSTSRNVANQVIGLGAGAAGKILTETVSGLSAAGSAYNQALQEGRTQEDATKYGIIMGVSEVLTEHLFGATRLFGAAGELTDVAKDAIGKNVKSAVGKFAVNFGVNALGEATEEYIQAVNEKLYRNMAYGEKLDYTAEDFFGKEALYSALLGGLSGGMMGSVIDGVSQLSSQGKYNYAGSVRDTAKAAGFTDTEVINQVAEWSASTKTPVLFTDKTFTDPVSGTQVDAIESDGVVFLSTKATNPMLELVVHEIAHTAQNTAQYQALLAEVKQSGMFASAGSWENAVARYQQYYAQEYGINYSFEQAQAEMVAKYIGENLYKSPESQKFVRQYMNGGLQRMLANRSYRQQYRAADAQGQQRLRQERALAEALRNRQKLTPEQIYATQQRIAEGDLTGAQFSIDGDIRNFDYSREKLARNIVVLAEMSPVFNVHESLLQDSGKTIKEIYEGYFSDWGGVLFSTELGQIDVNTSSIRSERRHGNTAEKIASIEAIPNVIENGKVIRVFEKDNGRVLRIVVAAPITISGKPYYMGAMIQRDNQHQRLYLHDVVIEEETPTPALDILHTTGSNTDRERLFISSILQQAINVKLNSQNQNGVNYSAGNSRLEDILLGARDVDAEYQQAIDTYGEMDVDRPIETPKRVDDSGQKVSQAASTFLNNAETEQEANVIKGGIVDAQYNYDPLKIETAKQKARARIDGENGIGYEAAAKDVAIKAADDDADAMLSISPADYVYYGELYDMAVAQGDYETAENCLLVMFEAASTSGKILAIQRNRMKQMLGGISKARAIKRDIARINNGFSTKYIEKHGRIKIPAKMYETLEKAKTPEEIEAAEAAIYDKAAEQWKATALEKWTNYRYLAMLGNPKTWNKNTASNWANFGLSHADNLMSVAFNKMFGGKYDIEQASTILWHKSELGKQIQPAVHERAAEVAEAEAEHKYQDRPQSEIESRRKRFGDSNIGKSKKSGKLAKTVGKGFDKINQGLDYLSDKTDQIMQTGVIETVTKGKYGKKISGGDKAMFARAWEFYAGNYMVANNLTEITAEVENYATKMAQELVFHSDNAISKTVQKIRQSSKGAAAIIDFAMPFVRTPANVLQQGFQRSPVGLITNGIKLYKEMHTAHKSGKNSGGKASADTINKFSRGVTGTMLFAIGMLLAYAGVASGKEDESAKGRAGSELGGNQPLSFNVFGTSISFDWLEPASYPFLIGVLFEQGLEESDTSGAVIDAICAGYNEIFDMSMLAGLTEIFDTGSYGQDKNMIGDAAAKLLTNAVTQSIPTVVGQLARTIDPVKRKTTSGDSVFTDVLGDNFLSDTASTIASRIPFASTLLEPERDVWGNEVGRSGDSVLLNAVNQFVSPAALNSGSGYDDDLVTQIVMDLYERTGDAKVIPTELDKNKAREELGDDYNSKTFQELRQEVGDAQYEAIYELITSGEPMELYENYTDANGKRRRKKYNKTFDEMTDAEKVKVISNTASDAKTQAIDDYVEAFENILP